MGKVIDLTGQRFGMLLAIERFAHYKNNRTYYQCECDCGNKKNINGSDLANGRSKSCGCNKQEKMTKAASIVNTKHHLSNTKIYHVFIQMKRRCLNPKSKPYYNYGGRGIAICDEWKNDFISFYNWAIQNGYKENLQINRIDNNGNYCPENCNFVTHKENQNNKQKRLIAKGRLKSELDGEKYEVIDYAEFKGIKALKSGRPRKAVPNAND